MKRPIIKDDAEAWNFLVNYVKEYGEFRVHTSKKGIKVFMRFGYRPLTGYYKSYILKYKRPQAPKPPFPIFYHKDHFEEGTEVYEASIVAKTLLEAVQQHISKFPMNTCVCDFVADIVTEVVDNENFMTNYFN